MPSLISHLDAKAKRELFDELNYLNMSELRSFCKRHKIPYTIWVEREDGTRKRTKDTDRKSVVLDRIRKYLTTGRVPDATCFSARVVSLERPPKKLMSTHRLYYGWYDKSNTDMVNLLRRLTGGAFRNGAIARILARQFWTAGTAPTFTQFAEAWVKANKKGLGIADGLHPEAAWLTDRSRNQAGNNWKAKRKQIATGVLRTLAAIKLK